MRVIILIREDVGETVSAMPKFTSKSAKVLECQRIQTLLSDLLTDMNDLVEEYAKVKSAKSQEEGRRIGKFWKCAERRKV